MGAEASKVDNTLKILALGDSLTEGEDHKPYATFLPDLLAPHLAAGWQVDISNQGVSGETTDEIKERAPYRGWDLVVLLAGTNDLGDCDTEVIWKNLLAMYSKFEEKNTTVMAVTIPDIRMEKQPGWLRDRRNAVNSKINAWVQEKPLQRMLLDLFTEMKVITSHEHLWARDGLHFSAEGYRHFASLIAATLATSPVCAGKPWHKSSPKV